MHTCRFLFSEKNTSRNVLDANTNQRPYWVRGDDLEIEFALENQDGTFLTAADIGAIEVVVRAANESEFEPKRMVKTLGSGDCNPSFQPEHWVSGSSLATVSWSSIEAALEVPEGKTSQAYFIYAVHTDPNGLKTTYGGYKVEVRKAPHARPTLAAPVPPEEPVLTPSQADERYLRAEQVLSDSGKLALSHEFDPNSGEHIFGWIPMDEDADANTLHGFTFRVGETDILKLTARSDNSGDLSEATAYVHSLKLTDDGDQEATAFSLGYNARQIAAFSADGTTDWTLPKGVLINRIVLIQSGGVGVDNIAVEGLSITAQLSGLKLVNSFDLRRNAQEVLLPDSAFPISDSNGESLVISADQWNDAGVNVYVFYEYLPDPE